MIKRNSSEWDTFINRLNTIKTKSNREVLCIKCWQMLNCKQKIKHLKGFPDHKAYLLTSTQYASELKICELAQGYNKLIKKNDGYEYMISPFAPVNLPLLNKDQIVFNNSGDVSPNPKPVEGQTSGKRTYRKRESQCKEELNIPPEVAAPAND